MRFDMEEYKITFPFLWHFRMSVVLLYLLYGIYLSTTLPSYFKYSFFECCTTNHEFLTHVGIQ